MPGVTSWLSSYFIPGVALSLSSSFLPGVASSLLSSFLPSMACGMHGRLPTCTAVFHPVRCGLRYVWRSSVLPGAAFAAVFFSARRSMHGVLPFRPGWYAQRSSVPPGAAYAEVFSCVWRGPVCVAVFYSVWRGPVCAAFFRSARRGIGVLFCLARPGVHGGPPFCQARHAWCSSVLLGAACTAFFRSAWGCMRGGLLFHPVRHMRQCSVLSGAARYARWCSVLPGAA